MEHSQLTGSDLHEPKGVSGATAGTVYEADGAGSGTWVSPFTNLNNANKLVLNSYLPNISASASSCFVACPTAGSVTAVYIVLQNAVTTANANIVAKIGGTLISGVTITVVPGGSGAGVVYSATASGANSLLAGQAVEVHSDGGSTATCAAWVSVVVDVS